ncbi:RNA recognition domain-containing protein [Coniochaeta sp. 2T2.1]|nr:RNA recognition domain-containing protein [Coniochaeta sp. 2T2.1]
MSTRPPSRVVFVGNIPYGLSEEQISDIFSQAGKVLNFRLVYDRETGRPKGFGFAEYPDSDSAASAVRNLNDHEIMGRKLRVDFSNEGTDGDGDGDGNNRGRDGPSTNGHSAAQQHQGQGQQSGGSLPPLPPGKELPPGVTCTDAISRTLNTLPPAQLLDVLGQMKQLATTDPARATELLTQAPQLSYAIFQALLLMGLVSPEAINSVIGTSAGGAPPPEAPPVQQQQQQQPPPVQMPTGYPGYPPQGYANTPPVHAGGYGAPPPQQVAPPPQPAPVAQDPAALMAAVMNLPQETIDQLPEAERQQVLALRAQFGAAQQQQR